MSNDIVDIFGKPLTLADLTRIDPPQIQLSDAMAIEDITPPNEIILDGAIHRFGKKNIYWYVGYSDGIQAAAFGNWQTGEKYHWTQNIGRELSPMEQMANSKRMAELKKVREEGLKIIREQAATNAEAIWHDASDASPTHPYLVKKGIKCHGVKIGGDGRLILPILDTNGDIKSLQYIAVDSGKMFLKGGATSEGFWFLDGKSDTIYLAEGFATAASINEVSGCVTYIGYSASNLPKVAKILRDKYGNQAKIVIVGDNDKNGVGKKYAEQAAQDIGASVIIPPIEGDANDYLMAGHDLSALLTPKSYGYLRYLNDILSDIKPISWIIKGLIPKSGFGLLFGASGVGKSYIALDMALSIVTNKSNWFGYKIRGGKVAYLAGEGVAGVGLRAKLWLQENGGDIGENFLLSENATDLNTPDGYNKVVSELDALDFKPVVIFVDTLHRFMMGDENSAQDAKTMIDACGGLQKKYNCTIILVHHTGVSGEAQNRARGSSAWKGASDFEIGVLPVEDNHDLFEITNHKQKDGKQAPPLFGERMVKPINGMIDEDGDVVTNCVIIQVQKPEIVKKENDKTREAKDRFERAWFASGAEIYCDAPYVTRSGLMDYLMQNEGMKENSASQVLKPSANGKLINLLQKEKLITDSLHGWIVSDNDWLSIMMLRLG